MKRFYCRFRTLFLTLALGLASVYMFNGTLKNAAGIEIELPKFQSESVIFVTPKSRLCMPSGGHGFLLSEEFIKERKAKCLATNQ